jgi:reticulon-4-interacting protein 1, mitochondrial
VVDGGEGSPPSHRVTAGLIGSRPMSTAAAVEKICRVVVVPHFEGPEVLEIRQGVPVPDLKPQEVLMRAHHLHQPLRLGG